MKVGTMDRYFVDTLGENALVADTRIFSPLAGAGPGLCDPIGRYMYLFERSKLRANVRPLNGAQSAPRERLEPSNRGSE